MNRVRQSAFARGFLLPFALLVWLSACHKWVPLESPYVPSQEEYGKFRITNERGIPVVLKEPRLDGDSVWGTMVTSYWEHGDLRHREEGVVIPMESVQKIEKRGADTAATIGLVVGIVGGLALLGLALGSPMDMSFDPFEDHREN